MLVLHRLYFSAEMSEVLIKFNAFYEKIFSPGVARLFPFGQIGKNENNLSPSTPGRFSPCVKVRSPGNDDEQFM